MIASLAGARVGITRAPEQASALAEGVTLRGGVPVLVPCLCLAGPETTGPLDRALALLPDGYDGVLFASTNAVRWTFERTASSVFDGVLVAAVGRATAEALEARGVAVTVVPADFRAEGLLAALDEHAAPDGLAGTRWLLPRGDVAREVLPDGLEARGARVDRVVAYRNLAPPPGPLAAALEQGLDAITFASGSAVQRLAQALGPRFVELLSDVVVASIGPVTSRACRDLGLDVQVEPPTARVEALLDGLAAHWERRA